MLTHFRLHIFFKTLVGLCACAFLSAQTTIHVPADKPTIQAAMDAASSGDTVLVAPGTYHETVNFNGKGITLASADGADNTILDGGGTIPLVYIGSVDPNYPATLHGFTIRNGFSAANSITYMGQTVTGSVNAGGAVVALAPSVISANKIIDNKTCGIDVWSGGVTIEGNSILRNIVAGPPPNNCVGGAGGIMLFGASPLLRSPGVHYSFRGPTVVRSNTISNNVASGISGVLGSAEGTIERNLIQNNQANGILALGSGNYTVSGNVISGNGDTGFVDFVVAALFTNNTVYGNDVSHKGDLFRPVSEISMSSVNSSQTMVNNIIVGASSVPAIDCVANPASPLSQQIWDHNLIFSDQGPVMAANACALDLARYGNLNVDPKFVGAATGDFHLLSTSPAIDAGTNSAVGITATDIEGTLRPQDATGRGYPTVDMGAYEVTGLAEVPPTSIVVTPSPSQVGVGAPVTLTARLTSALGTPTGTVTFFQDGPTVLGEATLNGGQASWTISAATPGIHRVYARYDGQAGFAPGISVYAEYSVLILSGTSLQITASPSSTIVDGSSVTFTVTSASADGTIPSPITLSIDAKQVATLTPDSSGVSTYTATNLSLGSHTVTAAFAGDSLHGLSSASLVEQVVFGFPSTTTLRSSVNPATSGAPVTFTAVVAAIKDGPLAPPAGSVIFSESATTLGTETLTPSEAASYASITVPSLSAGSHIITATYVPAAVFASSTASITEVVGVAVPDFSLTSSPIVNVVAEHHASMQVTVTSVGGFRGTVQLACGPLPAHAVCYFDQGSSVNLEANGTASVLVDLETSDVKGYKGATRGPSGTPLLALLPAAMFVVFRRRRLPRLLAMALFAIAGLVTLNGCSGKLPGYTPPGMYMFQITGVSGSLTHTSAVKLVVSPE